LIWIKDKYEILLDHGGRVFVAARKGRYVTAMFRDRTAAGTRLAERVSRLNAENPLVIALPRGGVPVGAAIARRLGAPLDVIVARKIGAPDQPELAIGAVAEAAGGDEDGGAAVTILNQRIIAQLGLSKRSVARLRAAKLDEVAERAARYRAGRPALAVEGRTVVLVDDGIATGATTEAALRALRRLQPRRIVLAVPVAPRETIEKLRFAADEVICLAQPEDFLAIGSFYDDFTQVEDAEVARLLAQLAPNAPGVAEPPID